MCVCMMVCVRAFEASRRVRDAPARAGGGQGDGMHCGRGNVRVGRGSTARASVCGAFNGGGGGRRRTDRRPCAGNICVQRAPGRAGADGMWHNADG